VPRSIGFGKSLAARVVEKDPVFLLCPDGVGLQQAWSLNLEEQTARLHSTMDQGLLQGGLAGVELVMAAQPLVKPR
jgi:hypothetical protein